MVNLAEDQKRVEEQLQKLSELEANLDHKQVVDELLIERMRGDLKAEMKLESTQIEISDKREAEQLHKVNLDQKRAEDELLIERIRGDMEAEKKLKSIQIEISDKAEKLDSLDTLNQTLIIKERIAKYELEEARKELIHGLMDSHANICVKRMGELDKKPFHAATKRLYNNSKEAAEKAKELCSLWQAYLGDPGWHPYKVFRKDKNVEEVIDEDDEKLKGLKSEYGNEVYQAVVTALNELNEYNPSGRYPVLQLWNKEAKRSASLAEGAEQIVKQFKRLKKTF